MVTNFISEVTYASDIRINQLSLHLRVAKPLSNHFYGIIAIYRYAARIWQKSCGYTWEIEYTVTPTTFSCKV